MLLMFHNNMYIFILILDVETVLQEQVRGAQEGLQAHLHQHQPEQQQQLEAVTETEHYFLETHSQILLTSAV